MSLNPGTPFTGAWSALALSGRNHGEVTMNALPQVTRRLQPTGALREDSLYIERASDQELFDALLAGEFCSVLAPRQIGKSSLRVRTARQLSQKGVHCAQIDLTTLGKAADRDPIATWYFSLASRIADELNLDEPKPFFEQYNGLLAADRFGLYLRRQVLPALSAPIVVFLDEIDYIRALPVDRDEFFVAIRALYNERAQQPTLCRLTFCLLGVASPKDLVEKPEITPFNIGRAVHLVDFSRSEIEPFADAVEPLGENPRDWLDEVYRWTAGHPYMTQTLCAKLLKQFQQRCLDASPADSVAQAAASVFLQRGRSEDSNLGYAEKRLDESPLKGELLSLYRQLLEQDHIRYEGGDPVQQELQLCGMAAPATGDLKVRNRVFASVFDLNWLAEKETQSTLARALQSWHQSGRSAGALLRGPPLRQAREWAREHPRDITIDEREFLNICFDTAQQESEQRRLTNPGTFQRKAYNVALLGTALLGIVSITSRLMYSPYAPAQEAESHQPKSGHEVMLVASPPRIEKVEDVYSSLAVAGLLGEPDPVLDMAQATAELVVELSEIVEPEPGIESKRPIIHKNPAAFPDQFRLEGADSINSDVKNSIVDCLRKNLRPFVLFKGMTIELARTGTLFVVDAPRVVFKTNLNGCLRQRLSEVGSDIPKSVTIRVKR